MSDASLRLTYLAEDNHHGELTATVVSGAFSGRGRAWFNKDDLKAFLIALHAFPHTVSTPPKIEGGFYSKNQRGVLEHCFLRIEVSAFGSHKTPLVKIDLMSQPSDTRLPAETWILQKVEARFFTDYASIDRFADDFEKILDGQLEEAVLEGEAIG